MKKENFIKILKNIKSNFFIFKKNYVNYFLGEDIRNNKLIKKNFDFIFFKIFLKFSFFIVR